MKSLSKEAIKQEATTAGISFNEEWKAFIDKLISTYKDDTCVHTNKCFSEPEAVSSLVVYVIHNLLLEAKTLGQKIHIISIGIIAWNISIFSSENRIKAIEDVLDFLKLEKNSPERQSQLSMIQELVSRKNSPYKEAKRFVRDFVTPDDQRINLQVFCDSNLEIYAG